MQTIHPVSENEDYLIGKLEQLLATLIAFPSITPEDATCQDYIAALLRQHGFTVEHFPSGKVSNLWARRGTSQPFLVFAGHTDVVDPGKNTAWHTPPFHLTKKGTDYYGRGTADMKGALAAMLLAAINFSESYPHFKGSLGFLLTSGEEGNDFLDGTPHVLSEIQKQGIHIDYCVFGEPSSEQYLGDTIKNGRRGSLTGWVTIFGTQGHVAYPHLAENALHHALKPLDALADYVWDKGNPFFPPTSLQLTHISAGVGTGNIIPGELSCQFNFRFNNEWTASALQQAVQEIFEKAALSFELTWRLSGEPFLTERGTLISALQKSIEKIVRKPAQLSTTGGTSDARFIAKNVKEVIEFGLKNNTIHQHNERIACVDLLALHKIYFELINLIFVKT